MQDKQRTKGCGHSDLWKGLASGIVGGLVASWTMNRFQDVWSKFAKGMENWSDNQFQNVWGEFGEDVGESSDAQGSKSPTPEVQDDTTVRAASAVSEKLFDH